MIYLGQIIFRNIVDLAFVFYFFGIVSVYEMAGLKGKKRSNIETYI